MADIHTLDIARQRDDELLSRHIDGECSAYERLDLEVLLATDSDLRARLEEFRANDAAFTTVIGAQDNTVNTGVADRLANYAARDNRTSTPIYKFAMAATVLVATAIVTVNNLWTSPLSDTPQMDAVLAKALSTEPSAADGWSNVDD